MLDTTEWSDAVFYSTDRDHLEVVRKKLVNKLGSSNLDDGELVIEEKDLQQETEFYSEDDVAEIAKELPCCDVVEVYCSRGTMELRCKFMSDYE